MAKDGAFHLVRNGEAYFIKGAGGDGSRELLRACGGNSVRTWGVDNLGAVLDEAQKHGLTVTAGIGRPQGARIRLQQPHPDRGAVGTGARGVREVQEPSGVAGVGDRQRDGNQRGRREPGRVVRGREYRRRGAQARSDHPTMTVIAEIGGNKVRTSSGSALTSTSSASTATAEDRPSPRATGRPEERSRMWSPNTARQECGRSAGTHGAHHPELTSTAKAEAIGNLHRLNSQSAALSWRIRVHLGTQAGATATWLAFFRTAAALARSTPSRVGRASRRGTAAPRSPASKSMARTSCSPAQRRASRSRSPTRTATRSR